MQQLYNFSVKLVNNLLPLTASFNPKMRQFVEGRRETFGRLESGLNREDRVIWFHMASLGEFEQGVPILEVVRKKYPEHKILISFFSPSGYEIKKDSPLADLVVYLPLDTPSNTERFLDLAHPELVIFIKYEFWPNYLQALKSRNVRTLLVSGAFRGNQLFFKPWGKWMRKFLHSFEHFFVQNKRSGELLNSVGFENVTVSGDTRFDRVAKQIELDNRLEFVEDFKSGKTCIVAGSTWPEDEALLEDFINAADRDVKFIIAPHSIRQERIKKFRQRLNKESVLFSDKEEKELAGYQVLIVDTIGLLSKIYSYADIAYVGGAAGNTGLHNILEPATFGVPVVIGQNFENFPEAHQLRRLAGLYSVADSGELCEILNKLLEDKEFRKKTGMITGHFINSNTGATRVFEDYLEKTGN